MAAFTIEGTLTIPTTEPSTGGIYDDLSVRLFFITGGTEVLMDSSAVTTSNTFSFTYEDDGQQVRVKLVRISNGTILNETAVRGVLPRSFLKDTPEPSLSFDNKNWLFDAGLAVLATSAGSYFSLAKEITDGITASIISGSTLPNSVNHVFGTTDVDANAKTSTVAIAAYSLGYYLLKNPLALNKIEVADTLYDLLGWLLQRKNSINYGGLFVGGVTYTYASTVDNVLTYFAFRQAGRILNPALYSISESLAIAIKEILFNSTTNRFKHSLLAGGGFNNSDNLELNLFGSLFLIEEDMDDEASSILQHIEATYDSLDTINNTDGYKLKATDNTTWYEGSYGVSILYRKLGNIQKYSSIKRSLNTTLNDDGSYRYGIIKDGQLNLLDYKSVGSTAWGYLANKVPNEIFTVTSGSTLSGIPVRYYSEAVSSAFTRNDCAVGATGTTVTYTVPTAAYISTVSQSDANALAVADVAANGQNFANSNGVCNVPSTFFNTLRTGIFEKNCSLSGLSFGGSYHTFTVAANTFGSSISQADAEAQADAKLIIDGQANANAIGTCSLIPEKVVFTPIKTVINDVSNDDIFLSYSATSVINTGVTITGRHRFGNLEPWITSPVQGMNQGATTTSPVFIGSVEAGASAGVTLQATGVTPSSFGYQTYTVLPAIDSFSNTQQSAYFIKSTCGGNTTANSVLEYVVSAGTYTSSISQNDTDAMAWNDIINNGQAWVDANPLATCGALFGNTIQSSGFTSNACGFPLTGSTYIYTVPANTYQASSLSGANALAIADIAANGQFFANTFGGCVMPTNYRTITIIPRVDSFGLFDDVYGTALITGSNLPRIANTDLTISYELYNTANGVSYLPNAPFTILNGTDGSDEILMLQVPAGQGERVIATITSITPSSFDGINYIF